MARRGDCHGEVLSDLPSGGCLCTNCRVYRCTRRNRFMGLSLFAWANNERVQCDDHTPPQYRGLEGVRP